MAVKNLSLEIHTGPNTEFAFDDTNPLDVLALYLGHFVAENQDDWNTSRDSRTVNGPIDEVLKAYDEIVDVSPNLALAMIAYAITELPGLMERGTKVGTQVEITSLFQSTLKKTEKGIHFLEDKPNVDRIYSKLLTTTYGHDIPILT